MKTMNNKRKKYETDMNPFWAFEFDRDNIVDSKDDDTTLAKIFDSVTLQPPQLSLENYNSILKDTQESQESQESHHLYCLIEREFLKSGEKIYKVGKSVHLSQRMNSYPKGSTIISIFKVNDCHTTEKILLKRLDKELSFRNAREIGREYYEADLTSLLKIFIEVCMSDLWI